MSEGLQTFGNQWSGGFDRKVLDISSEEGMGVAHALDLGSALMPDDQDFEKQESWRRDNALDLSVADMPQDGPERPPAGEAPKAGEAPILKNQEPDNGSISQGPDGPNINGSDSVRSNRRGNKGNSN